MSQRARAKVVIPAVCVLLVFLVGFPIWQRAPHSVLGLAFGWFFAAILGVAVVVGVVVGLVNLIGPFFGFSPLREIWSDLRRRDN